MSDLLHSLLLSLRIALAATGVIALVGVPVAYVLARHRFTGRSIVETILTVPLVLPPTVVGYGLMLLFGTRGLLGSIFQRISGEPFVFSESSAIVAAVVVAMPLLLLPARAAFAAVEPEFEQIAQLFGAGALQVFWHVNLPLARRGVASGLLLAFARSLGEFGATMMVFGAQEDRLTLPISVYQDFVANNFRHAAPALVLLTTVSLIVIAVYNRWPGGIPGTSGPK